MSMKNIIGVAVAIGAAESLFANESERKTRVVEDSVFGGRSYGKKIRYRPQPPRSMTDEERAYYAQHKNLTNYTPSPDRS